MKLILSAAILSFSFALPAQTEVYNEDFQGGIPVSYTIVDNDGLTPAIAVSEFTSAWITKADPDNTNDTVAASTSFFDPTGQADRWLITPAITLGAYGNILYWEARSHDPSYPDGYDVYISTTDTQLASFTDTLFKTTGELAEWNPHAVNLSEEGYNSATVHLAFVNRSNDRFKLYIDDIRVEIEDPLSVENIKTVEPKIYPNPATDQFTVNIKLKSVVILDLAGQEVLRTTNQTIMTSALSNGSYLVVIEHESGTSVQPLVIQ